MRANLELLVQRAMGTPPISTTLVSDAAGATASRMGVRALKRWEPQAENSRWKNSFHPPCRKRKIATRTGHPKEALGKNECELVDVPRCSILPAKRPRDEMCGAWFEELGANRYRDAQQLALPAQLPDELRGRDVAGNLLA